MFGVFHGIFLSAAFLTVSRASRSFNRIFAMLLFLFTLTIAEIEAFPANDFNSVTPFAAVIWLAPLVQRGIYIVLTLRRIRRFSSDLRDLLSDNVGRPVSAGDLFPAAGPSGGACCPGSGCHPVNHVRGRGVNATDFEPHGTKPVEGVALHSRFRDSEERGLNNPEREYQVTESDRKIVYKI